ncbi:MAG: hypothetical protein JO166_22295 [Deltaproteobacteria bacterium]|nr:hypothetical protein [Deltaproteobacteria bacterium]
MKTHPVEIEHADNDRRVFVRVNGYEVDIYVDDEGLLVTLYRQGQLTGELSADF